MKTVIIISLLCWGCSSSSTNVGTPSTGGSAGAATGGQAGAQTGGSAGTAGQAAGGTAGSVTGGSAGVGAAGDAGSDAPSPICTPAEAFDMTKLPTSAVWNAFNGENSGTCVSCANAPCDLFKIDWTGAVPEWLDSDTVRLRLGNPPGPHYVEVKTGTCGGTSAQCLLNVGVVIWVDLKIIPGIPVEIERFEGFAGLGPYCGATTAAVQAALFPDLQAAVAATVMPCPTK